MQIVIDIDEDVFTRLFDNGTEDYAIVNDDLFAIAKAIRKGTPLPKGHGRLIEVTNRLEQELFTFQRYTGIDEAPYESATIITDRAPTIIDADKESD